MSANRATCRTDVATLLERAGARPGRPVAACTGAAGTLALLARAVPTLGCPLFPIDPALPGAVVEDLIAQAGAELLVGSGAPLTEEALLAADDGPPAPSRLKPADVALLIATSGSSGRPKAVMLTAANLDAAARASAAATPLGAGDRWLACLPLFHVGGMMIVHRCAVAGADAVLHQGFEAAPVSAALAAGRITHLSLVPAMLARLLDFGPPPPTLRHVLVGGAALSAELASRAAALGWPIQPTYGMSETASQIATLPALPAAWTPGHVGRPLPGVEVALTDDGRLKVRGPMVMAGYANPRLAPGDGLEDGWFVTSDLAEIRSDGSLVILGRADDLIVSGGKKVPPALVENELARCPGVLDVAVVGRPDPVWGQVVTAVYSGTPAPEELLAWCREHLAGALRPRAALRIAAWPRLANGKPDRLALRRLAEGMEAETGPGVQEQPAGD